MNLNGSGIISFMSAGWEQQPSSLFHLAAAEAQNPLRACLSVTCLTDCSVMSSTLWQDWEKRRSKFLWQMLGCLILSHMGLNTFRTPWDSTNKQWLLYKHPGTSLSCSIGSGFIFCVWDILRRIPVVPSWCPLRLTAHHRLLSAGSLGAAGLEEPTSSACSSLFHPAVSSPAPWRSCPDQLVELGSCRLPWTPIKYWCLAFCAGWLTKEELYETAIEKHSG